jgi:hypothetical protein
MNTLIYKPVYVSGENEGKPLEEIAIVQPKHETPQFKAWRQVAWGLLIETATLVAALIYVAIAGA